jgi:hypothetical protein
LAEAQARVLHALIARWVMVDVHVRTMTAMACRLAAQRSATYYTR